MERTGDEARLSPEEGWRTIQATMEEARSSMYVAGTATILLLWGHIISLGYLAEYALGTVLADFRDDNAWVSAPLWIALVAAGMAGSYYGAKLTGKVSLDSLVLVMGFVLLAVGGLLIWQGVSS